MKNLGRRPTLSPIFWLNARLIRAYLLLMTSWVITISIIGAVDAITARPANCPALVKLVSEIRVASRTSSPFDTARVPNPKLTEKYRL